MAKELVTDELWETIALLLPSEPPKLKGGRPRVDARAALTGIIFVLKSSISWEMLPQEMGCGSGVTCWRRLREWQEAGVWKRVNPSGFCSYKNHSFRGYTALSQRTRMSRGGKGWPTQAKR